MAYDNTCKFLAETYPRAFTRWLLNSTSENVQVLKTEIIPEPIRSDALILLQVDGKILHLEFQTRPYSNPPIPYRMLNYWTLLYGQYWCEIEQVVIYLKETQSELVLQSQFRQQNTQHRYRVIRLWEEDPEQFMSDRCLLPFATLTRTQEPRQLLEQVTRQLGTIESQGLKYNLSTASEILAGLRFDKNLIRRLFREELMKESVIYQDILQTGIQRGEQRGLERGLQLGLQRGEANLLLRLLTRNLGAFSPTIEEKIINLSLSQLEKLTDAQFEFETMEDLVQWLEKEQNPTDK